MAPPKVPLTWRNVQAPNAAGVLAQANAAGQQIGNSISQIGTTLQEGVDTYVDYNTQEVLAALQGAPTDAARAQIISDAGQFIDASLLNQERRTMEQQDFARAAEQRAVKLFAPQLRTETANADIAESDARVAIVSEPARGKAPEFENKKIQSGIDLNNATINLRKLEAEAEQQNIDAANFELNERREVSAAVANIAELNASQGPDIASARGEELLIDLTRKGYDVSRLRAEIEQVTGRQLATVSQTALQTAGLLDANGAPLLDGRQYTPVVKDALIRAMQQELMQGNRMPAETALRRATLAVESNARLAPLFKEGAEYWGKTTQEQNIQNIVAQPRNVMQDPTATPREILESLDVAFKDLRGREGTEKAQAQLAELRAGYLSDLPFNIRDVALTSFWNVSQGKDTEGPLITLKSSDQITTTDLDTARRNTKEFLKSQGLTTVTADEVDRFLLKGIESNQGLSTIVAEARAINTFAAEVRAKELTDARDRAVAAQDVQKAIDIGADAFRLKITGKPEAATAELTNSIWEHYSDFGYQESENAPSVSIGDRKITKNSVQEAVNDIVSAVQTELGRSAVTPAMLVQIRNSLLNGNVVNTLWGDNKMSIRMRDGSAVKVSSIDSPDERKKLIDALLPPLQAGNTYSNGLLDARENILEQAVERAQSAIDQPLPRPDQRGGPAAQKRIRDRRQGELLSAQEALERFRSNFRN